MAKSISASIDLAKLKSAPYTTSKGTKCIMIPLDQNGIYSGEKGTYLNISIWRNDEKDKYENDTSISISQSKEQVNSGEKPVYIGNGKVVWESHKKDTETPAYKSDEPTTDEIDELPI